MSQDVHPFANGTDPEPRWQAQLAVVARALPYPPTPNLAAAWAGPARDRLLARPPALSPRLVRGLAWSLAAIALLLAVIVHGALGVYLWKTRFEPKYKSTRTK